MIDSPEVNQPEVPGITKADAEITGNYDTGFTVIFTNLGEGETGRIKIITNGDGRVDKTAEAEILGSKDNFKVNVKNHLKKGEYILQAYVGETLLKEVNFELNADMYIEDDD